MEGYILEPREVHTDENRALPEKKQKRIVKTPSQVAALENFYNEHKYPTEAMKLELAESIGLTEKQVSGWFCHRRLKDKKSPNDEVQTHGKQDRSSGVIQDRGSGLRQDSCGSTKQVDNKHSDPKEVESRRFTSEGLLPIQLRFDHGSQDNNILMDEEDTSSGSSLPLKDNFHPQIISKYPNHNELKRSGPSGYLKVKCQGENAAIAAVKRQLGRHYREDGPPLGIEFDQPPPGAFEDPLSIPVNQSYYIGDRTALHSLHGPNANKMHERYNQKIYHPDESGSEIRHHEYNQTPPLSKHRHSLSGRNVNEDSIHDQREHFETRTNHGPGVIRRPDSLIAYGQGKQAENYQRNHTPKLIYRDRIEPITSTRLCRNTLQDDEYSKLASATIHPGKEMRVTKRSRGEFTHQGYPRTTMTNRSTVQMTSSFSDNENTSSGD